MSFSSTPPRPSRVVAPATTPAATHPPTAPGIIARDGSVEPTHAPPAEHSPWELFEPGTSSAAARAEAPALDAGLRARLLEASEAAAATNRFEVFREVGPRLGPA